MISCHCITAIDYHSLESLWRCVCYQLGCTDLNVYSFSNSTESELTHLSTTWLRFYFLSPDAGLALFLTQCSLLLAQTLLRVPGNVHTGACDEIASFFADSPNRDWEQVLSRDPDSLLLNNKLRVSDRHRALHQSTRLHLRCASCFLSEKLVFEINSAFASLEGRLPLKER